MNRTKASLLGGKNPAPLMASPSQLPARETSGIRRIHRDVDALEALLGERLALGARLDEAVDSPHPHMRTALAIAGSDSYPTAQPVCKRCVALLKPGMVKGMAPEGGVGSGGGGGVGGGGGGGGSGGGSGGDGGEASGDGARDAARRANDHVELAPERLAHLEHPVNVHAFISADRIVPCIQLQNINGINACVLTGAEYAVLSSHALFACQCTRICKR